MSARSPRPAASRPAPRGGTSAAPSKLAAPAALRVPSVKGEITIWNRSGDLFKVFDAAIGKFRAAYPGVKVNHQAVDIDAKLANTLISGTGVPDGSFWDDAKIGGQAEHLYDLTDLIAPYRDRTRAVQAVRQHRRRQDLRRCRGTWTPGCCGTARTSCRTPESTRRGSARTTTC